MNKYQLLMYAQALGDSLLLPYENLGRKKALARLNRYHGKEITQSLLPGFGMISDDTEHMVLTAQALLISKNAENFEKNLKFALKWWLVSLPPGIGMATLKSCIKMWLGLKTTGVYSAGNGPVMRVPIIALYFAHDKNQRNQYIRSSTHLTHTDPKTLCASFAFGNLIAYLAEHKCKPTHAQLEKLLLDIPGESQAWNI